MIVYMPIAFRPIGQRSGMQKTTQGRLLYSPTDIVRFLESPFASWMERLHVEFPDSVTPDEDSEELKLIANEGTRHEERLLLGIRFSKPGFPACP